MIMCWATSRPWFGRPGAGRRLRWGSRPGRAWRSSAGPGPWRRSKGATTWCRTTSRRSCLPALRHRVMLTPEAEIEGRSADELLTELIRSVEVPLR